MKRISITAGTVILVMLGIWLLGDSESRKSTDEANSKPAVEDSDGPGESGRDRATQSWLAGRPFEIDSDRLYDRGYANDPGVQALAKAHGLPPACLVALAKYALHQVPVATGVCPDPEKAAQFPTLAVGKDHPYNQYSNSQLRSLATSSPEAAVILARRLESDAEARNMYERAVALSGIAEPLVEWMTVRDTGGLLHENGELDVELAKQGYKVYFVAGALEGASESTIEAYEEELLKAGVDVIAIQREAAEELARIRTLRQELTGGERP